MCASIGSRRRWQSSKSPMRQGRPLGRPVGRRRAVAVAAVRMQPGLLLLQPFVQCAYLRGQFRVLPQQLCVLPQQLRILIAQSPELIHQGRQLTRQFTALICQKSYLTCLLQYQRVARCYVVWQFQTVTFLLKYLLQRRSPDLFR